MQIIKTQDIRNRQMTHWAWQQYRSRFNIWAHVHISAEKINCREWLLCILGAAATKRTRKLKLYLETRPVSCPLMLQKSTLNGEISLICQKRTQGNGVLTGWQCKILFFCDRKDRFNQQAHISKSLSVVTSCTLNHQSWKMFYFFYLFTSGYRDFCFYSITYSTEP